MLSSDSVDGLLFLCGLQNLQYWIGDGPKPSFCLRLVVLINTLCSVLTFIMVNLRGWGGYWDMLWGRGGDGDRGRGDGYSVHGDVWGWGSVSVPVQTSSLSPTGKPYR